MLSVMTTYYRRSKNILDLFPAMHDEPYMVIENPDQALERMVQGKDRCSESSLFHNFLSEEEARQIAFAPEEEAERLVRHFKDYDRSPYNGALSWFFRLALFENPKQTPRSPSLDFLLFFGCYSPD